MRLFILSLALLGPLLAVSLASGHAAPERFDPAPGTVLSAAPQEAQGWFTQDVRRQEGASFIRVFDAGGMEVDEGQPVVDDADRRHVSVNLNSGLEAGRYMVAWQTLSDEDGELDGGCYWFFVGQEAADKAHEEKLRINAPDDCPVDLEEASALFTKPEETTATITIDVPAEVEGLDVTVGLSTDGATIRGPTGSGQDPAFGHYHLYLDQVPVFAHSHANESDMGTDGTMGSPSVTPNYGRDIMVVSDSYTYKGLAPGNHVVTAALFYDDHTPFQPPVTQMVTFKVAGGGGGGASTGTVIIIAIAAAAGGLILGGAAATVIRRRRIAA